MKAGVLGTGFGSVHARIYKNMPEVEEIYVYGRNEEKLAKLKEELGVKTVTDIMDIMNNEEIDLVDVCLPSAVHREYVTMALEHGKHVFCETPVAYTMEDAEQMKEAADKNNKKAMVDLFIRFETANAIAARYAKEKRYGKIKRIVIQRNTAPHWGDLGLESIVDNLMMHDIDFVSQLLGDTELIRVNCTAGEPGQSAVSAFLTYPDAYAEIQASSMMPEGYPFTVAYEIIFDRAVLRFFQEFGENMPKPQLTLFADGKREELPFDEEDCYSNAIRYTLQMLSSDEKPIHDISEAIGSLKLALMINEKLKKA